MLIRATIVLLVVLNLGVAAWWLWRPAPVPPASAQPPGVPQLVLLEEIELPPAPPPATETLAGESACEEADGAPGTGDWRVYLPPATDLASAEATARRIADAGFQDYLVQREGESANGIALGVYSTEASAERRAGELRSKGFPARCARITASTPA